MIGDAPKRAIGTWIIAAGCGLVVIAAVASVVGPVFFRSCDPSPHDHARAILRSAIFPAEIRYQAGAYRDRNGNSVGEFAELAALGASDVGLITGPLATADTAGGYRFAVHVPEALAEAERCFIAYAWPVSADPRSHAYAMTEDGVVRESPSAIAADRIPAWNAALPDGWGRPSSWPALAQALEERSRARAAEDR